MQRPDTICSAISTVLATCSFSSISEAVWKSMAHSHTCIESWRWFLAWLFKTKCCMLESRHGDEYVLLPLPTCFLAGLPPSSSGWNDSLENKDHLVFKTFQQLPFSPRVKPVSVLWPASCHSGPHPLSIGLFAARLWAAPLLLSSLLAGPGALLPRGLCSHWMLTPSSFWSPSNTTFPVQLFLTPCLKLWFPTSTAGSYSLHHSSPPPSLVLQIPSPPPILFC